MYWIIYKYYVILFYFNPLKYTNQFLSAVTIQIKKDTVEPENKQEIKDEPLRLFKITPTDKKSQ